MNSWSKSDLSALVAYFRESLGWDFDVDKFDDRLRLQKLVYFANQYGLDSPYSYNIYRHGPYCPRLAEDYYDLDPSTDPYSMRVKFDSEGFEQLVKNRSNDWLEVASTVHKLKAGLEGQSSASDIRGHTIRQVADMKDVSEDRASEIYSEVQTAT